MLGSHCSFPTLVPTDFHAGGSPDGTIPLNRRSGSQLMHCRLNLYTVGIAAKGLWIAEA